MDQNGLISKAIEIAIKYGSIDGDHHKAWVIDQMVRALTDCPVKEKVAVSDNGEMYTHEYLGESEAYLDIVNGCIENGYDWDIGIIP